MGLPGAASGEFRFDAYLKAVSADTGTGSATQAGLNDGGHAFVLGRADPSPLPPALWVVPGGLAPEGQWSPLPAGGGRCAKGHERHLIRSGHSVVLRTLQ